MTFLPAPLAVDGARLTSAHIRKGTYASTSGNEGLVEKVDLKVSQLPVAGPGLLISAGNAVLLNRYQAVPNESYVVANPDTHTVGSESMPASQPSAKSYLVCVVVGDAEFSSVGHPFMPAEPLDAEEAATFTYVRPYLIECPAGTTSFTQLGLSYPAYALARLDIPAGVTNITNAHITDLRKMARPRVSDEMFIVSGMTSNPLNTVAPSWEVWGTNIPVVDIPSWATKAKIHAFFESAMISKAMDANLRVTVVGGPSTVSQRFNRSAPTAGADRVGMNLAGSVDVSSIAGTSKTFRIEGQAVASDSANGLTTDGMTSSMIRIRFEEVPV